MRICLVVLLFTVTLGAITPALALNDDDLAAAMGMLWRLQSGTCPTMSFDPAKLAAKIGPHGMSIEEVRRKFRKAFDRGYALGGEEMDQGGAARYCDVVEGFFGGTRDFYGNRREVPEAPFPGVTIGR